MSALREKIVVKPMAEVKPHPKNPRQHTPEQIDLLVQSYERFGYLQPILVDGDGVIIAGHARYAALRKARATEVLVIRADHLTPEQADAVRVADNRLSELSEWDDVQLAEVLFELGEDAQSLGFTEQELAELTAGLADADFISDLAEDEDERDELEGEAEEATSPSYVVVAFAATPAERREINDAITKAKARYGVSKKTPALLAVLREISGVSS